MLQRRAVIRGNGQFGSSSPRMRILALRQKSISLRTSSSATSLGVVISTAPSMPDSFRKLLTLKCSSLVPGGVSTRRKSKSPHSTSLRNFLINPFFFPPLHITASSRFLLYLSVGMATAFKMGRWDSYGSINWILMTARLLTHTGDHPLPLTWIVSSRTPIMRGIDGPQISMSTNMSEVSNRLWNADCEGVS